MFKERWVWSRESIVPLNQYIDRYIIAGPMPLQCFFLKTRTCKKHTGENGLAIPIFRQQREVERYREYIEHKQRLFAQECWLEDLLASRNLPTNIFALDFDLSEKSKQNCTFIKVCDVERSYNFDTSAYT